MFEGGQSGNIFGAPVGSVPNNPELFGVVSNFSAVVDANRRLGGDPCPCPSPTISPSLSR